MAKAGLIILCIAIAVGSVFGILGGSIGLAFSGDYGWIALIVGSALLFISAVYSIFRISLSKRFPTTEREKKSPKYTLIWIVVAIASRAGAVLSYFFGLKMTHNK